jgi:hypothetical protein
MYIYIYIVASYFVFSMSIRKQVENFFVLLETSRTSRRLFYACEAVDCIIHIHMLTRNAVHTNLPMTFGNYLYPS